MIQAKELSKIQAKVQILLYLVDQYGNPEMYISKPFEYQYATVPDYKRYACKALKECCEQALEDHNIQIPQEVTPKYLLEIIEKNLDMEPTIYISGTTHRNRLEKLEVDDIAPEPIHPERAMEIFEDWVERLRKALKEGLESGELPLGEDFEMPEDLSYFTSFEIVSICINSTNLTCSTNNINAIRRISGTSKAIFSSLQSHTINFNFIAIGYFYAIQVSIQNISGRGAFIPTTSVYF